MDYFGINSPDDLPKIKEVLNQEIIEATKIEAIKNETPAEKNQNEFLQAEDETGEVVDINNTFPG